MDVALAEGAPVHELDAELEAAAGLAQELVLAEPERAVEPDEVGDGGLPHANGADLVPDSTSVSWQRPPRLRARRPPSSSRQCRRRR